jgi:hypothetical protein
MKGILFGGCSFTWGQGLYFYSNLNRIVLPKDEYSYDGKVLTDAHKKFKDTIRFPRLVANHFKTFEVLKNVNGGSEDETFMFFKNLFNDPYKNRLEEHFSNERYCYDDFHFLIIQVSQLHRNRFYFKIDEIEHWTNFSPRSTDQDITRLLKWMEINNKTYEDWEEELKKQQIVRLEKELKFYEEKGLNIILLSWENQLLDGIKNNEYLNSKFIQLEYDNEKFETIFDLQQKHKNMVIKYDYDFFGDDPPKDHHPSKLCHQVIANSIINHIQKNYL